MNPYARIFTGLITLLLLAHLFADPTFFAARVSADPPPPGLLSDAPEDSQDDRLPDEYPRHPAERRSRRARLNTDGLPGMGHRLAPQSQADTLRFNLFSDVDLLAEVEAGGDAPLGGVYLRGRLAGQPLSEWTLIERDGLVSAGIHTGDRYYQITPLGDGETVVQEIDLAALPPEAEPLRPDPPADALGAPGLPDASILAAGSPVIDVLVVYTAEARASVANINDLIATAVIQTNTGYQNSQINQRIRVVHTAEVNYSEAGLNWPNTLSRLAGASDGTLDGVHTLRNQYAADAVVLLVQSTNGGVCGIAYLMAGLSSAYANSAFAVVSTVCATTNLSFAHELGHLMGANHDRQNSSGPVIFPYAYGYQDPGGAFRTVMAYNCPTFCPRINYWSNPDVSYGGRPTGVYHLDPINSADNRLTLNQTAATVANFRIPMADLKHRAYLPMVTR